jgi:hypothetical protein
MTKRLGLGLLALSFSACMPAVAPANSGDVPRERATECASVCTKLGMRLSAVVVMMNSAGCVCEPLPPGASAPPPTPALPGAAPAAPGASAAAGGVSIAAAQAAAATALMQQQQQQRNQQQYYRATH